ncbi:C40 family peptidase [Bacillus sp. FJAT-42315]|uniref:C40 family peptidase n=1 Tax=Bacillus sp. FJAT-42315 TaxID=2014077 RepID=UPI000C2508EE|nr:C40 family peptidase [Bacillus sp. FJAT-42315]
MKKKFFAFGLATAMVFSAGTSVLGAAPATKVPVQQITKEQQIKNIVAYAKKLKGTPYKQGGTTTKGFDASGYVHHVFTKNKVKLARNSADIQKQGTNVELKKLKEGDLVFYNTTGKPSKKASFVGIYIGKNQFMGVTTKNGVSVIDMNNKYWKSKYLGAKRIIK